MKSRIFVFGVVLAAILFLFQRLLDSQAQLARTEAELSKLQREHAAREQAYAEAYQGYQAFDDEHPLPDDPDKKLRIAMMDAVISAEVKEQLGDNYLDDEEDES